MVRAKFWSRYIYTPTFSAPNNATFDLVMTLQPGETLLRTIITQDTWLQSSTTVAMDAGERSAWGFIFGPSNTSVPLLPLTSFSAVTPRWIYVDQIIFDIAQISVVAGSASYIARNSERNRYTDTQAKLFNDTGGPLYGWLCQEFDPAIPANATVISTAAVSGLILGP